MYGLGETRDNVLLNFDDDDGVIVYGKAGLGVTIMAGISMIVLPCRGAIFETVKLCRRKEEGEEGEKTPLTKHMKEKVRGCENNVGEIVHPVMEVILTPPPPPASTWTRPWTPSPSNTTLPSQSPKTPPHLANSSAT